MFGGILVLLFIIVAIIGPYFTPYDPGQTNYQVKLAPPSADHWFGTDHHGRDILAGLHKWRKRLTLSALLFNSFLYAKKEHSLSLRSFLLYKI